MTAVGATLAQGFGDDDPFVGPKNNILIAHSPDYVPPRDDVPLYAHDWWAILIQCRQSLDRRRAAYPKMIDRKLIEADVAARDIGAWELLVAEWSWICGAVGNPPPATSINDRIAAVELAQVRVTRELETGNRRHEIFAQAHLMAALHWHLIHHHHGEPHVYRSARVNHLIRKDQGATWCDHCDRWIGGKLSNACTRTDCGKPIRTAA